MSFLPGSGMPNFLAQGSLSAYCAAIPGAFLCSKDLAGAAGALAHVLELSGGGLIPRSTKSKKPDAMGNLWFMRAAHLFGAAGGEAELFLGQLVPLCKRIVQEFITTGGVDGVVMDDGGLLVAPPAAAVSDVSPALISRRELRLNALWYSAVETTGVSLKAVGDRAGDHFERLAGRFRRSFAKSFWCDEHGSVCGVDARKLEGHGELPDVDQLLLTVLPASPIPRTKQRQILQVVRSRALGSIGMVENHPVYGRVESVVHRAWMVIGLLSSADARNTAIPEATEMAGPLLALVGGAGRMGVPALYKDGKPVEGMGVDALTTAEVHAAIELLRSS